ncbi:hypothetical protein LGV90_01245 [Streptococcus mutans]|nr:hypothetical protein [Streptococcus mutans]EMB92216.1 hypothetical protein SMU58_01109 [Streptococcus mutans A19]EMB95191.1 hypothetical protein SMU60_01859 [Streptococcus mutans U138]MCB5065835.1 hypothetical protein [Streptococcus mutans]NLQ35968.1 hypothetical protein [Streptococcus mutans]
MESEKIILSLDREYGEENAVVLYSDDEKYKINLSNDNTTDIKKFFDTVFDEIISNQKLISFELSNDESSDLFHSVGEDLISQLNAEIQDSKEKFKEILELSKQVNFQEQQ